MEIKHKILLAHVVHSWMQIKSSYTLQFFNMSILHEYLLTQKFPELQ